MVDPTKYISQEYWNTAHTGTVPYKSQFFFENIGKKIEMPPGLKVQIGVAWGHTLQSMKQHWGCDQVIGIDIHNFTNDPNVYQVDVRNLTVEFPCAYIENDISGSQSEDGRLLRWVATKWAIRCLVPGGILITSADHMIKYPVSNYAVEHNCKVISMTKFDSEPWAQQMNRNTDWKTNNWLVIEKINNPH